MSMIINTNIPGINAHRKLKATEAKQATAFARLSSGLRINSAADDAAGLAISEKMKAQIQGLEKAERNVQDGVSLIQTAEGGMNEISEMVIRKRELIIQALNDTNTDEDRDKIQEEIDQLTEEIDAMAERTRFNNIPLLNVPFVSKIVSIDGSFQIGGSNPLNVTGLNGTTSTSTVDNTAVPPFEMVTLSGDTTSFSGSGTMEIGKINDVPAGISFTVRVDGPPGTIGPLGWQHKDLYLIGPNGEAFGFHEFSNVASGAGLAGSVSHIDRCCGANERFHIEGVTSVGAGTWTIEWRGDNPWNTNRPNLGNFEFNVQIITPALLQEQTDPPTDVEFGDLWIQSGANASQGIYIDRYDCRSSTLGIKPTLANPTSAAKLSLGRLDSALSTINSYRANCGAQHNRLEHIQNALGVAIMNLESANSRITDADMAKEMMLLSKVQVLTQAATAVLAQANQSPQTVLQLLQ